MTAPSSIAARFLAEQLQSASPDLLRSMLTTFINTLMSAEADVICRRRLPHVELGPGQRAQRLPAAGVRHPRRHAGGRDPQAVHRQLLSGLYATKRGERPRIQLVPGLGHHRLDRLQPEHVEKLYGNCSTKAPLRPLCCRHIESCRARCSWRCSAAAMWCLRSPRTRRAAWGKRSGTGSSPGAWCLTADA